VQENPTPPLTNPDPATLAVAPPAIADLTPAACAARLAELFPAVFGPGAFKPLKLRIQADIQQRVPGVFTKKALSIFLHRHTTSNGYLKALVGAPQRTDLDGLPAGDVADEHRQAATAELERRRAIHEARRATERDAQRTANEAARCAREADADAREHRAALLRSFETTTLTRKNFCALKGVPEVELDALLVQASVERNQRAPAQQLERPDLRGPQREPRPPHEHAAHRRPGGPAKPGR
jgi:sRNA-binding protein